MNTVVLDSQEGNQAGRSSYSLIAEYLNLEAAIRVRRSSSHTLASRVIRKAISKLAVSSWYGISSLQLEFLAATYDKSKLSLIHMLWADRDWGYLDSISLLKKIPLIGTFHACPDDFSSTVSQPQRLRNLDAILLMSEVQKDNFINAGVPEEHIHVIHHGIDTKHFKPLESSSLEKDYFEILHVGSYRRNFDVLEQVCDKISDHPFVRFKVITSASLANRFAGRQNVEVVSGLTDQQLLQAYQNASCLLMTAEAATANNAILEGISCGLPVVAERIGGIPEYVNENCAILCEPCDVNGLISALEFLSTNQENCQQMGQAARKRALELDWVHVAAKTQAVFDQVIAGRQ